jgi:hypothetical protein
MPRKSTLDGTAATSRFCHIKCTSFADLSKTQGLKLEVRLTGESATFEIFAEGDVDQANFTVEFC